MTSVLLPKGEFEEAFCSRRWLFSEMPNGTAHNLALTAVGAARVLAKQSVFAECTGSSHDAHDEGNCPGVLTIDSARSM